MEAAEGNPTRGTGEQHVMCANAIRETTTRRLSRKLSARKAPMDDELALHRAIGWARVLRIPYPVRLERVSTLHVTNEEGKPGCSLVGVVWDAWAACIFHTRRLSEEDIVHELLHVAFPHWSEDRVVEQTDRILGAENAEAAAAALVRNRRPPRRTAALRAGVSATCAGG